MIKNLISTFYTFLLVLLFSSYSNNSLTAQHCPANEVEIFFNLEYTGTTGQTPRVMVDTDIDGTYDDIVFMYDSESFMAPGGDGWYQASVCVPENSLIFYRYADHMGNWEDVLSAFQTANPGGAPCANSWPTNPCANCPVRTNGSAGWANRFLNVALDPINVHESFGACPSAMSGGLPTHHEVRNINVLPLGSDATIATDKVRNQQTGWLTFWNDVNNTPTDFSDDYIMLGIEEFNNFLQYNRAVVNPPPGASTQWHANNSSTFIDNPAGGSGRFTRIWDFNWPNALAADVGVRFYYTPAEFAAMNATITANGGTALVDESELELYKVTSGEFAWDIPNLAPGDVQMLTHGTIPSTSIFTYHAMPSNINAKYFEFKVAGFSGGTAVGTSAGNPSLPVELASFKASPRNKEVKLLWTTATEINNDHFLLEHSTDGRNFNAIGKVNGNGNTYEATEYEFMHKDPRNGINYYRLASVSYDGVLEYSEILTVSFENDEKLTVYPSLVSSDFINVVFRGDNIDVNVLNQTGQVLISQTLDMSTGINQLSVADLPAGVYYLSIQDNSIRETVKFIKQ